MKSSSLHSVRIDWLVLAMVLIAVLLFACSREQSSQQQPPATITAQMVTSTGCKTADPFARSADTSNCLYFAYTKSGDLAVTHVNAQLNCCKTGTDVTATIDGTRMTIREKEIYGENGPCKCLCRFDIQYTIKGVAPGKYLVKLDDPYYSAGNPMIEGYVDFTESPEDTVCATYREVKFRPVATYPHGTPQPME